MMKNKILNTILQQRAEQIAPNTSIDLWPEIQKHFAFQHAVLPNLDGGSRMKALSRKSKVMAFAILALLLVVTFVAFSPLGKAIANTVVDFFTTSDQTSFPVSGLLQPPAATHTPVIDPGTVEGCEGSAGLTYDCQVAIAEAQAGFDAWEFPADPQGVSFSSATASPNQGEIWITYDCAGGQVRLAQGMGKRPDSQWSEVPTQAVESVMVGELPGEFVRGRFTSNDFDGSGKATWNPDAPTLRLRWMDGERWFEIEKDGDTVPIEYLGLEELIDLATSLVAKP
jgi:hypothetical protein